MKFIHFYELLIYLYYKDIYYKHKYYALNNNKFYSNLMPKIYTYFLTPDLLG